MTARNETAGPELVLGERPLCVDDVVSVARARRRVALPGSVTAARMRESQAWVAAAVAAIDDAAAGEPTPAYYGINTGFGSLAGRESFTRAEDARELSRRLVLSDATGVGRYLEEEVVRAAILIRASSLAQGYSGVRVEVVSRLIEMLNRDVFPAVPAIGSVGAGDLIPLAHVVLLLSRPAGNDDPEELSGEAFHQGRKVSGKEAMAEAEIPRLVLEAKEGLALLNGSAFATALVTLAVADGWNLVRTSEVVVAMTLEACEGFRDAFIPEVHRLRGHAGQIESASNVYALLRGSHLVDGDVDSDPGRQPPQDALSIRCAPQVLGAVRDTLSFAHRIVETELNAAVDNPVVLVDLPASRTLKAVSNGNFHGEYLAFAADFLTIALTELGSIAERRIFRLNDGTLNRGLPDMLIDSRAVGLDCGFMLPQYLAAALVSECKTLAHPDAVDSIPTCSNQEDHVAMSMNAALHVREVAANVETIVGVEALMAAQALDLRLSGVRFDVVLAEGDVPSRNLAIELGAPAPPADAQGLRVVARRVELGAMSADALGRGTRAAFELIRSQCQEDGRPLRKVEQDTVLYPLVRAAIRLVRSGALAKVVGNAGTPVE